MDADIQKLSNAVIGEIFLALGFSKTGTAYRTFGWLFRKAADRLSTLFVTIDRMMVSDGFPEATAWATLFVSFVRSPPKTNAGPPSG